MSNEKVSFHNHTTTSDGGDRPEELVRKMLESGITDATISNHDSWYDMSPEGLVYLVQKGYTVQQVNKDGTQTKITTVEDYVAEQDIGIYTLSDAAGKSVELWRGVEFTVVHDDIQRHLIGLGMRHPDNEELERCDKIKRERYARLVNIVNEINQLIRSGNPKYIGLDQITATRLSEVVSLETVPSRLHVGYILSEMIQGKPELLNLLKREYDVDVITPRIAMDRYAGKHLEAYNLPSGTLPQLKEMVHKIHMFGGIAILPHIGRNGLGDEDNFIEALYGLVMLGRLDGIEVQAGKYNECTVSDRYVAIAKTLNQRTYPGILLPIPGRQLPFDHPQVLISLGVDFHGIMNGGHNADVIAGASFPHDYRDGKALDDLRVRLDYWKSTATSLEGP